MNTMNLKRWNLHNKRGAIIFFTMKSCIGTRASSFLRVLALNRFYCTGISAWGFFFPFLSLFPQFSASAENKYINLQILISVWQWWTTKKSERIIVRSFQTPVIFVRPIYSLGLQVTVHWLLKHHISEECHPLPLKRNINWNTTQLCSLNWSQTTWRNSCGLYGILRASSSFLKQKNKPKQKTITTKSNSWLVT